MNLSSLSTLDTWLKALSLQHPKAVDLGLERIDRVRQALALKPSCPIVIVGGTNGKGSVTRLLSTCWQRAGYKVGSYTSPHLLTFNERITVDLQAISDSQLVAAFSAIDSARSGLSLTYFEWGTLAAVLHFVAQQVDVIVLEVGLGGRLDAVNCFEPDVAIVVSVDLDHQHFLGPDREAIGFEKAGIFRAGKPAICADSNPPRRLVEHAHEIGAQLYLIGDDFHYDAIEHQWNFHMGDVHRYALPLPALRGTHQLTNAAAVLAALTVLHQTLPLDLGAIRRALLEVQWPARFEVLPGWPQIVLDVAHNPHAVAAMLANLQKLPFAARCFAVFSVLADKDLASIAQLAHPFFDAWFVGGLSEVIRGQSAESIAAQLAQQGIKNVSAYESVACAWEGALSQLQENDRIIVFGSFHTVAAVINARS